MDNKASTLFYQDDESIFSLLPDEQAGALIKAVLRYAFGGEVPAFPDLAMRLAFEHIRLHMDRDREKYEETIAKRREAGKKGGLAKEANASFASTNLANVANASFAKHNDNDNVNDNDNDSLKKSISKDMPKEKPQRFFPPTPEEVRAYASEKGYTNVDADRFCDFYGSKGWVVGKAKMKDWKAAVRNWNRSQREESPKTVRQETTAKRTRFVNYDQREVDYDAMLREGDWR